MNRENSKSTKPHLISLEGCPYVQRSVITLLEKDIAFDVSYVDLKNPPDWFLQISPFYKVPVLVIDDATVFESAVINEYLDEITPPSMHPADPLQKAINRGWIEFAGELLTAQYRYMMAGDAAAAEQALAENESLLRRLEDALTSEPFFNGDRFCLIDAAIAPYFSRAAVLEKYIENDLFESFPQVANWSSQLLARPSIIDSVPSDFETSFIAFILSKDTFTARTLKQAL
jgi:glutathione S-transferase